MLIPRHESTQRYPHWRFIRRRRQWTKAPLLRMLRRGSTRSGMVGRPQAQKLLDTELQVPARVAASFGRPQEALALEVRQQQVERPAQVVGAGIEETATGPGQARVAA